MKTIKRNYKKKSTVNKFKDLYNKLFCNRFIRRLETNISLRCALICNAHGKNYLKINSVSQQNL